MKIVLTGATGFVGRHLVRRLHAQGHDLVLLGRDSARLKERFPAFESFAWNLLNEPAPKEAIEGADVVIHLAGESIGNRRWSQDQKTKILNSRVLGTRNLVEAMNHSSAPASLLICSSAIGFYGDRGDEVLVEESHAGAGFLSEVCQKWESEAHLLSQSIRRVLLRTGIILHPDEGALKKMLPPFRMGLGGRMGSGSQWMSWIHIDDLVSIFIEAINNAKLQGPVNAVSSQPTRNQEFTSKLSETLHKPALLPVPEWGLRLVLGEMADLLLQSQRVIPKKLEEAQFLFKYPDLKTALSHLCSEYVDTVK